MICVGAEGTITSGQHKPGSTAAALGQSAFCPVAIVRRRHTHKPLPAGRWIIAALDESRASHAVLQTAMDEALLRKAPLLALTSWESEPGEASEDDGDTDLRAKLHRYLDEAEDDDADVKVCALPMPDVFRTCWSRAQPSISWSSLAQTTRSWSPKPLGRRPERFSAIPTARL
jgi:hypothetical protein